MKDLIYDREYKKEHVNFNRPKSTLKEIYLLDRLLDPPCRDWPN